MNYKIYMGRGLPEPPPGYTTVPHRNKNVVSEAFVSGYNLKEATKIYIDHKYGNTQNYLSSKISRGVIIRPSTGFSKTTKSSKTPKFA